MLQNRTDRHPVSPIPERKKMLMPELFRYRNKEAQSGTGMLRYHTEMIDAGIPMLAALALMPMPSYGNHRTLARTLCSGEEPNAIARKPNL